MNFFKRNFTYLFFILITLIICFAPMQTIFSNNFINSNISQMTAEDIKVEIIDDTTLTLENLINSSKYQYSWNVVTTYNGIQKTMSNTLPSNNSIKSTVRFDDISYVEFRAFITYKNVKYSSLAYNIDENGVLTESKIDDEYQEIALESYTRTISDIVSLAFVCFLVIISLLFYTVPKKFQWCVLLIASLFFYCLSGISYIIYILLSTISAYFIAKKMSKRQETLSEILKIEEDASIKKTLRVNSKKSIKFLLNIGLINILLVLIVMKYTNFTILNINTFFSKEIPFVNFLMPLGLSFYTFIIIGYLIDVSRGKYKAEQNFWHFLLFTTFFPQVTQGPISRYNDVSVSLKSPKSFNYENFCFGCQRILWGFFIKLVLADKIAILVQSVFSDIENSSSLMILIAVFAYSIQIYADFYSSMEIAIGSAQLFGVTLPENFLRPYFATTMPEFWRRWHVTLGTWFKDYVFYPVSMSKTLMKFGVKVRQKLGANSARIITAIPPILSVWSLTGLWHGASWNFVFWGLFHGFLIILSTIFTNIIPKALEKIGIKTKSFDYKFLQMAKVFILCSIGRIFFRAENLETAINIFKSIIILQNPTRWLDFSAINLGPAGYKILLLAIILLLITSILQEKIGSVREIIKNTNVWVRFSIWLALIVLILAFGNYGIGSSPVFIYENF